MQSNSLRIHPTAIIEEGAIIGEGCIIGPYSVIRSKVTLGNNNILNSHVVIEGETAIGNGNVFYPFSCIGSSPQVVSGVGSVSTLFIGDNNIFREYVTIQPGIERASGRTVVGNDNLFMISSHIGHDCIIGDHNRFTNSVGISGHVHVGNFAIIGGFSGVHQFVNIGDYAFVAGGSMVVMDVPPYCTVQGNHANLIQINNVGLIRQGFTQEQIALLKKIFRNLFIDEGLFAEKLITLKQEYQDIEYLAMLFKFIENSKRGVCVYKKKHDPV